ncbi:hypothetical protein FRC06_004358 [Ceratobasidium sp. 370]|nr:hypothetical protein FRC06_004358 [Ceratobasidium sp. 370]
MPPSRKRPAPGPAAEHPRRTRNPASEPPPDDSDDALEWSAIASESCFAIERYLLKWEADPAPLLNSYMYEFTLDRQRKDLLRLLNRLDAFMLRHNVPAAHPDYALTCVDCCPTSRAHSSKATSTDELATPAPAVDHKSVATDPLSEPMAIDSPALAPRSYASVAVGTPATPNPNTPDPKPPPKPQRSRPKGLGLAPARSTAPPVRLIVRPGPSPSAPEFPFAALFAKGPTEPYRLLSHALALNPPTKDVRLLGVHQNRNKNLVISLDPGTPDAVVAHVISISRTTLTPHYPRGPGPVPMVDRDIPWSKLLVSSVPTRSEPGAPVHSEANIQASFLLNPAISALKVTRPPRWIRNPASITGVHSSFTFSFEDPDGSLVRSLAKSSLFVFGVPVHLKHWVDKPLATRKETRRRRKDS